MNFSEKLIDLRKKKGLSQEELGDKLGVTRQTISKWELGETTPEMNKIKEISKLFEVDTDYLLNENKNEVTTNNDNKQNNKKGKSTREKVVLSIVLTLLIASIIGTGTILFVKHEKNKENGENFFNNFFDNFFGKFEDEFTDNNDFEHDKIEAHKGTTVGMFVKVTIDDIITYNNKSDDNKIKIVFEDKEYITNEEIETIKSNINDTKSYNIKYEYKDKKICTAIIKREVTSMEVDSFNNELEFMYSGTKTGFYVEKLFDKLISINNKKENNVTLVFNGTETNDPKEIRNLKNQLGQFDEYEISYEYNDNGLIHKAIVERV